MQSNNPVFTRSEEFQRGGANTYGNQTYAGNGSSYQGYGTDPSTWGTGEPGQPGTPTRAPESSGPMTIDSVVQKTGISLGVVIVAALATWILTPEITTRTTNEDLGSLIAAMTIGSLGAFALSMVNSFKRVISPALVLAFCVLEGVALGALSKFFDAQFGDGVVSGAVIGTFAAFAGTLTAYKVLNIKVGDKFRKFVVAAVFGMIGLSLMELVLSMFGAEIGLFGVSGLGMVTAVAGLVLGVFMLIMDFDFVEQGVANRLPERESWRAAFAMTVSLVWIYTNLLRILAFFSQD
ncbi:Bax inhibitor-1/YccA family protein [Nocardioides sp. cx-173]|uniref:Bax inhibitor-1/YccA family protein n=1 Tax=Nocardioides sp. cx-173 TaxID=2898796 RepID=UPI001E60B4A4|nr:Bax inhibitor-1/YccA family protein [Nocardioides sp. cx-173]MCD4525484.1 Bax inhibitor-1/YccA family protein [Nocardioides sp. cx-173]UGB42629.1 Bax inhibitor-1/YccA family protein [Nocardioides sp. cx-173]